MKLSEIHPNPGNPRLIKDDRFKKLCQSIKEFPKMMSLRPIIVDKDGMILGGNMRFKVLKELGYKDIPDEWVKRDSELTEAEKQRFIVVDNVAFGEWDFDILANEWDKEKLIEWGLELPETEPIEEPKAIDDHFEVPEEVETDIIEGDVIDIGKHRIICGDSTKPETYQKLMGGGKMAELIVTDPPYNVDYGPKAKMLEKYDKGHRNTYKIKNDNMSKPAFYQFLLDFYSTVIGFIKPGASIYVWHAESSSLEFRNAFIKAGFDLKQCLIWVKNSLVLGRQDYQWKHEPCLYGWKPGAAHYFTPDRTNTTVFDDKIDPRKLHKDELLKIVENLFSEKTKTTVLYHNRPSISAEHPTMKPVPLLGELITNSSKSGWLVLDPFIGSGSTMVAAHQLNRICYGIELDPKYCQVIVDRLLKFEPDIEIKKNGVLWERKVTA